MAGNVYIYIGDWITDTNEPDQGVPPGFPPVIGYDRDPSFITIGLWENDVSLPGSFNTAVGSQAGAVRTTGDRNIDIGYQSGPAVDFDGSDNISIGYLAGSAKTAGDDNIYIGNNGSSLTTESDTIRIGTVGTHANTYIAGDSIIFGDGSVTLTSTETFLQGNVNIDGFKYIKSFERGQNRDTNLSIGKNSMDEDSSAGAPSGPATTVMVGPNAGFFITDGQRNTGLGHNAMFNASSFTQDNTCIGASSGSGLVSGISNTVIGALANAVGDDSIVIGKSAGSNNSGGDSNIYIGSSGPASTSTESDTIRIGTPGTHTDSFIAGDILAIGNPAFSTSTQIRTGLAAKSTNIGLDAGGSKTGQDSVYIGYHCGSWGTGGSQNVYVGASCGGQHAGTGTGNVLIGDHAGYGLPGVDGRTNTICIGKDAGNQMGHNRDNCIFIGNSGGPANPGGDGLVRIGEESLIQDTYLAGTLHILPGVGNTESELELTKPDTTTNIVTMTDNNTLSTQLGDQVTEAMPASSSGTLLDVSSNAGIYYSVGSSASHTGFTGATDGQRFTVLANGAYTIFHTHNQGAGPNTSLSGKNDFVMAYGDSIDFVYKELDPVTPGNENLYTETGRMITTWAGSKVGTRPLGDGTTLQLSGSGPVDPEIYTGQNSLVISARTVPTTIPQFVAPGGSLIADGQRWTFRCGIEDILLKQSVTSLGMWLKDGKDFQMKDGDTISFVQYQAANRSYETSRTYATAPVVGTFTDQDATPTVGLYPNQSVFQTNNTISTTYTDFTDGVVGETITVIVNDAFSVFDFTASNLKGNNSIDWSPASGDHLSATYNGTSWYCDVSEN